MSAVLEIRSSPHVHAGRGVDWIMWQVVLALLPVTVFAVYCFGSAALLTLTTATMSCVLFEHLWTRRAPAGSAVADGSGAVTGLLYGLTLPPTLPLWMNVVGAAVAVGLGKHLFGGLGANCFNPALVGRAVLQASFPVAMTTWHPPLLADRFGLPPASLWTPPLLKPVLELDAVSHATPLSAWKFDSQLTGLLDLTLGYSAGSTGETASLWIALGGAYLIARRLMNWRITASMLGAAALTGALAHAIDPALCPGALFTLTSGGLMLGAVFMATDMVGSPMTNLGCVLYASLIGVVAVVIRVWGGMPEGVMYAILLGNALTPIIDRQIRPRVYGTRPAGGAS